MHFVHNVYALFTLAGAYTASSRRARICSTPLLEAASSSSTSRNPPLSIPRQLGQRLQGFPFSGCSQFTALARILAQVVFPVPRVPVNRYAWDSRPSATWRLSVSVICPVPPHLQRSWAAICDRAPDTKAKPPFVQIGILSTAKRILRAAKMRLPGTPLSAVGRRRLRRCTTLQKGPGPSEKTQKPCASIPFQTRHPRGTWTFPLNAARFPA